ncbi:MAG: class I SAM-dependent methyltransferase [Trueperaceae bacterium]|nr:class I SAM-dependent methyltransferase [Trueperaceae bacterium]
MSTREINRDAWNYYAEQGDRWSTAVSSNEITQARQGNWHVYLTESKAVPRSWFGELLGKAVLCLASGGGQQVPILAAAGGKVTSFDNSPKQLALDKMVAEREGLSIDLEEGDMCDLSRFKHESFDLIFHPCSNLFILDVRPVWLECFRVLKPGGILLSGFLNPMEYIFDWEQEDRGILEVKHHLPFSSLETYGETYLREQRETSEYSHSLESQIGGQLAAGFILTDLYESFREAGSSPKAKYFPSYLATRALKPGLS